MIVKNRFNDCDIGEFDISPNANLRGANLRGADLRGANLRGADLREADLREADLYEANLYEADLRGANLYWADLRGANLRGANLYWADLRGANLRGARYNPLTILQARWKGAISDGLCTAMMAFDRECHPHPEKFKEWADGDGCPIYSSPISRALIFDERREQYNHSRAAPNVWELWTWIAREFEIEI